MTLPHETDSGAPAPRAPRQSKWSIAVSWGLAITTALIAAGLLGFGFVMLVLGVSFWQWVAAAEGLILLGIGFLVARRFVKELREARAQTWPHRSAPAAH
jgi:hypothetical protein